MRILKNVTLLQESINGELHWFLLHQDGSRDRFFDYYFEDLLRKRASINTRKAYCYAIARFIDYLIEIETLITAKYATNYDFGFESLIQMISDYPKALACATGTANIMIAEVCKNLKIKPLKHKSQIIHIAAVNRYLHLSEAFNIKLQEIGYNELNGIPLSNTHLFLSSSKKSKLNRFEKHMISSKSVLGGVISGGAKLRRCVTISPYFSDSRFSQTKNFYLEEACFPLEKAQDLLANGFLSIMHKLLFCLLMATGCRICEAVMVTFADIDVEKRRVRLINPQLRGKLAYNNFFSIEQLASVPWKGRSTPLTFMIEPFATEFWRLLKLYINNEMIFTSRHPLLFQITKGVRRGDPLVLSDMSNLRKIMKSACKRINIKPIGIHSLRRMYAVYCINYIPVAPNKFGINESIVQFLLGHSSIESTRCYAKPDLELLKIAITVNSSILKGFSIESKRTAIINMLQIRLREIEDEVNRNAIYLE